MNIATMQQTCRHRQNNIDMMQLVCMHNIANSANSLKNSLEHALLTMRAICGE